ncbi:MAG: N-acetylmuramoyl-L-alanine amidase [Armatimonadetes bacterium]|nr:N-acetylmuramoyl-L-alanine amidase [Armatimonadota bacterium]
MKRFLSLLICLVIFLAGTVQAQTALSDFEPASDTLLQQKDTLWVSFRGAPGGSAVFQISGGKEFPMAEAPDRPGSYTGAVQLSAFPILDQAEVTFHLRTGGGETTGKAPGKISVIPDASVLVGSTTRNDAILRGGPGEDFIRLAHLPSSVRLRIIGKTGQWYKVFLAGDRAGFLHQDGCRPAPSGVWPSRPVLSMIRATAEKNRIRIRITLGERGAYLVRQTLDPPALVLELPGCTSSLFETVYDIKDAYVRQIQVDQPDSDLTRVYVTLSRHVPGGYSLSYENNDLLLDIRPSLNDQGYRTLKGVRIVLDPGHGGSDSGAVGVYGTREKDMNLDTARELRRLLLKAGASVVMTRENDADVTSPQATAREELEARVNIGKKNEGQLFISIHHNAMASIREARRARGTFVYFYHPQSGDLAREIVTHLAPAIGEPRFTIINRSFAVIRQTYMPAVLVEVAFISNPVEELKLRRGDYRKKVAQGILKGIQALFRY